MDLKFELKEVTERERLKVEDASVESISDFIQAYVSAFRFALLK